MSFNVNEFRSNLIGDGARPNLFSVTLTFPTFVANGSVAGQKTTFMAKGAQLPGSSLYCMKLRQEEGPFVRSTIQRRGSLAIDERKSPCCKNE